ncbi:hypothetical protein ACB098_05G192900 [Castanea mollissima]
MGLLSTTVALTDQIASELLAESENPFEPIDSDPESPVIELFLLAIQTTVGGMFLYLMPKYLLLELPGLKNPSSKRCPDDTKVWPSLSTWFGLKMSETTVAAVEVCDAEDNQM